jgi:hypothetical protein
MSRSRDVSAFELGRERRELVRLVRRIQALALELHELQQRHASTAELHTKERTLEQLRWRLAAVARSAASDDLGRRRLTTSAAPSLSARTAGRLPTWLSVWHSLRAAALTAAAD